MAGGYRRARGGGTGQDTRSQTFPQEREKSEVAYQFWNCSDGTASEQGSWAKGPSPDGKGEFEYLPDPQPMGETVEELAPGDPLLHGTPKKPMPPAAS
ncbi:manganese catalase family protein [Chelativorans sp. YIM 93263]|uniref:manganese catalase family protein n=1 Tax=Chelativorans sp. YIM 93263 TaxID=2906648 RepID=UPI00308286F5